MLSSYDIAASLLIGATIVGYGYVTYAALAIRRTIAGSLYKKQALGIALVAVLYALNSITGFYPTGAEINLYNFLVTFTFPLAFVTIFYWVDASALAARLTDPLLRDTLRWSRLRFLIWAINISAIAFSFSYVFYLALNGGTFPASPPFLFLAIFVTPAYVSVVSGAVVLLVAVRRTADRTLRRHLEWFGFYLVFIFVFGGLIGVGLGAYSVEWSNLVGGAANAAGAPFLYKSARSLIPLYKFSNQVVNQ